MQNSLGSGDVLVRLEKLCKSFDDEPILKDINLEIKDKQFVTLLGPSGCGKTTILRLIGGFEKPTSGHVLFNNKVVDDIPPHERAVNTVFQKYALFPHLNVFDNVAFGLSLKKVPKKEIAEKVRKMLALVDLKGYEKRSVSKLSGGQQQRVAIARALINMPRLLLLDEPLGALDLKLRKDMQLELKNIQKQSNITFLYVTHDQEEALTMSDIIVVMKSGTVQQIGTPQDIYNEPANAFVADFIGEANILDGKMFKDYEVNVCDHTFPCVDPRPNGRKHVDVVIRPEDISLVQPDSGFLDGVVESCLFKGVHYDTTVNVNGYIWVISSTSPATVGERVGISVTPDNIHIMRKLYPSNINTVETEVTDAYDSSFEIEINSKTYVLDNTGRGFDKGDRIRIAVNPFDISVVGDFECDFMGYLDSIIWKANHYEYIVETDERRFLIKRDIDEQVATDIGIRLNLEKAEISLISRASEETEDEK